MLTLSRKTLNRPGVSTGSAFSARLAAGTAGLPDQPRTYFLPGLLPVTAFTVASVAALTLASAVCAACLAALLKFS